METSSSHLLDGHAGIGPGDLGERTVETGLASGSLAGFRIGPDGRAWFVDMNAGAMLRLDPRQEAGVKLPQS